MRLCLYHRSIKVPKLEILKHLYYNKQKISSVLDHKVSKKMVLKELENDFDGYGKSVKAVMNAYQSGNLADASIYGPLS